MYVCIYIYIHICYIYYIYMVFTNEGFFEVGKESWPEWNLNLPTLNSVETL